MSWHFRLPHCIDLVRIENCQLCVHLVPQTQLFYISFHWVIKWVFVCKMSVEPEDDFLAAVEIQTLPNVLKNRFWMYNFYLQLQVGVVNIRCYCGIWLINTIIISIASAWFLNKSLFHLSALQSWKAYSLTFCTKTGRRLGFTSRSTKNRTNV